jgi:hypothetical protein
MLNREAMLIETEIQNRKETQGVVYRPVSGLQAGFGVYGVLDREVKWTGVGEQRDVR